MHKDKKKIKILVVEDDRKWLKLFYVRERWETYEK